LLTPFEVFLKPASVIRRWLAMHAIKENGRMESAPILSERAGNTSIFHPNRFCSHLDTPLEVWTLLAVLWIAQFALTIEAEAIG
jgi:hypothetical protein